MRTTPPRRHIRTWADPRTSPPRLLIFGVISLAAVLAGCSGTSDDRAGLAEIPTRTTAASSTTADVDSAAEVADFTVLPTFTCLKDEPARSIVTVGWSAPSATAVALSLDGRVLPAGIQTELPYQVPAGGPTGIGAAVVFDCAAAAVHTLDIEWTTGASPQSRTVTITKDANNG